jgi:hypothetical protein
MLPHTLLRNFRWKYCTYCWCSVRYICNDSLFHMIPYTLKFKQNIIYLDTATNSMVFSSVLSTLLLSSRLIDYLLLHFPLENIYLIWRSHHCQCRAANLGLCSVPRAVSAVANLPLCLGFCGLELSHATHKRMLAPYSNLDPTQYTYILVYICNVCPNSFRFST